MILILTHENSDFDSVASQWATRRLHPEATPLLSRRVNRNVHQYLTLYWGAFEFMAADDWRRRHVAQVFLVDTQALPNLRGLRDDAPVMVIDHHAGQAQKSGWRYYVEAVGATTTLLVEQIEAQGLAITPEEATLFMLGIYEDSGNLTYDAVTARDVRAAAWLLDQGAVLPTVRRFLQIPLTPPQQELYARLQAHAEWINVEGHAILLAATPGPENFDDEISAVATRLRDALVPSAMVLLVQMPYRTHLVARSATDSIDVSVIARALGGGGHSRAAAATVHSDDLGGLRQKVLALLPQSIQPTTRVSDLMSHLVKTVPMSATVAEAAVEMQRYGHEGYPVVDENGQVVGLLTRQAVDRSLNHKLGHVPVKQVMRDGQVTVRPTDSAYQVQSLMLSEGWGQIPVADEAGQLVGIVTRTDILRLLTRPPQDSAESNLQTLLAAALPPSLWRMVKRISHVAGELNMPLYFVGGLVRDVLLGLPATDLDMVAEGDAITLARTLARQYAGDTRTHARFGTAKWLLNPDVWRAIWDGTAPPPEPSLPESIDFVTARTEFYTEPTVLPTVQQSSIKLDLHRRDFTINTLAIRLDGAHLGELLDFYGGRRDLQQGVIRVLHSLSFVEDPTRILRAVRFEQRLRFQIAPRTLELLRNSADLLQQITGPRIRHELELCLAEPQPARILHRLAELDILPHVCQGLTWPAEAAAAFERLPALLQDPAWAQAHRDDTPAPLYFFLWLTPHSAEIQTALMDRLRVRKTTRADMQLIGQLRQIVAGFTAATSAADVVRQLRAFAAHPRALLAVRAFTPETDAAYQLDHYQREWRHVRSQIDGHDLRELGLKPGPIFQVILETLLTARLDGHIQTAAEERALLRKLLAELETDRGPA